MSLQPHFLGFCFMEEWRGIPDFEGIYEVSDWGRVQSMDRIVIHINGKCQRIKGRLLKFKISKKGYYRVGLRNKGQKFFSVHVLVGIAFKNHIPCGHKLVINHRDFDRLNNRASNLEIVTMRVNGDQKHLPSVSQFVGVSWCKDSQKWRATIHISGKQKSLGRFTNELEASQVYQEALSNHLQLPQ